MSLLFSYMGCGGLAGRTKLSRRNLLTSGCPLCYLCTADPVLLAVSTSFASPYSCLLSATALLLFALLRLAALLLRGCGTSPLSFGLAPVMLKIAGLLQKRAISSCFSSLFCTLLRPADALSVFLRSLRKNITGPSVNFLQQPRSIATG